MLIIVANPLLAINCPNGLSTTVSGSKYIRVNSSGSTTYSCAGSPAGGTYYWSCSAGLSIESGQYTSSVEIKATTVSNNPDDQYVKCVYSVSGLQCEDEIKVTNVQFSLSNAVFWNGYESDGTTRLNVTGYPSTGYIEVQGLSSGTYTWQITAGTDKLELAADGAGTPTFASSVSENGNNQIFIRSKAGSASAFDIKIALNYDGQRVYEISMSVGQATTLDLVSITHSGYNILYLGGIGYDTIVSYRLKDQFGNYMGSYPIGEFFPSSAHNYVSNNWPPAVTGGYNTSTTGYLSDYLTVHLSPVTRYPVPQTPQSPLGTEKVRGCTQELRGGKATSSLSDQTAGVPLRTNYMINYRDHASITTDGTEHY